MVVNLHAVWRPIALSHFSGPPTTSEVSCASFEFPTATLLVLLSEDGVAYSFWKLDVGEGSPLRVNYFRPRRNDPQLLCGRLRRLQGLSRNCGG